MLEELKVSPNRIVGLKQALKAIKERKAEKIFVAGDVDDYVLDKIEKACSIEGYEIIEVDSMKILGEICGIEVGAAVAVTLKK